jgi:hypothetical protein
MEQDGTTLYWNSYDIHIHWKQSDLNSRWREEFEIRTLYILKHTHLMVTILLPTYGTFHDEQTWNQVLLPTYGTFHDEQTWNQVVRFGLKCKS